MKTNRTYVNLFFIAWALLMVIAVAIALLTPEQKICRYYDEKIEAANLTNQAFEAIYQYKIEHGIEISKDDINNTGLIGDKYTSITTTLGILEAKRTSINPNFAAVILDMLKESGIKKGDEVGVIFSSSFPALNIAVLSVLEVFDLKPCIMGSIGASSYGANNPSLTFYDMSEYLYQIGIFKNRINLVSLGGASDIGSDFMDDNEKNEIISRIKSNKTDFLYESDYVQNLNFRKKYFYENVPNIKILINVGGNLVAMGRDECAFIDHNGLVKASYYGVNKHKNNDKKGLMDYYLEEGINVIHMLNIKGLAVEYGLPYDPLNKVEIESGDVYFETSFDLTIPLIAIGLSIIFLCGYFVYRKKVVQ